MLTSRRFRSSLRRLAARTAACAAVVLALGAPIAPAHADDGRIHPWADNPFYWQYRGEPILLLGGTDQDNLFNHPDLAPRGLERHLDVLVGAGGNYVRNTMSHRDAGNEFAFARTEDGRFDLDRWNPEYWDRFERFLAMTAERGIIVQLELWETWDFYGDHEPQGGWSKHPFNPDNNVNYTAEESGLPTEIDYFPAAGPTDHSFFHTVPDLEDNPLVLAHQQRLIEKTLSIAFNYDHVLYCVNNETGEPVEWGEYWVKFALDKAAERGVQIEITDMRRSEDLTSDDHRYTQDRPELYRYVEISQNNGTTRSGQDHYDQIMRVRQYLTDNDLVRPMNNVKVYGGDEGWGGPEEGKRKFWRNLFAGCASIRFHRRFPGAGIGLDERAQRHLAAARAVTDRIDVLNAEPRNDLLGEREDNEAYLLAETDRGRYAIYFPDGGEVTLDIHVVEGELELLWYEITANRWHEADQIPAGDTARLTTPGDGPWAAVIRRSE